jgi:hypothetical protein
MNYFANFWGIIAISVTLLIICDSLCTDNCGLATLSHYHTDEFMWVRTEVANIIRALCTLQDHAERFCDQVGANLKTWTCIIRVTIRYRRVVARSSVSAISDLILAKTREVLVEGLERRPR